MKNLCQKLSVKVIALCVILALSISLVMSICLYQRDKDTPTNNDEGNNSVSNMIAGKFTDREIKGVEDAILAVQDVKEELGLTNAVEELTVATTNTVDNITYYRLQQNYKGIPVYGSQVIVISNEKGEAQGLTGNAVDVDTEISLTPTVTYDQVVSSIQAYVGAEAVISVPELSDDMIVIYENDLDEPTLTYCLYVKINGNPHEIFIDAIDSTVLCCLTLSFSANGLTNYDGSITVYDADRYVSTDFEEYFFNAKTPNKGDTMATTLLNLIEVTSDFYSIVLNRKGFNDRNGTVLAAYNCSFYNTDGHIYGNNGISTTPSKESIFTYLRFGYDLNISTDVVAHEYAHSVERSISYLKYQLQSGAIMEGYSDFFGELIEAWSKNKSFSGDCDWENDFRNIHDPSKTKNPSTVSDQYFYPTSTDYVHQNSTIISHVGYLMTHNLDLIELNWNTKKLSYEQAAKLWYQTLYILPYDCSFTNFRECIEFTAQLQGIEGAQKNQIEKAFEKVKIADSEEKVNSEFTITIKQGANIYKNFTIEVKGIDNDFYEKQNAQLYVSAPVDVRLNKGKKYIIIITDNDSGATWIKNIKVVAKNGLSDITFNFDNYTHQHGFVSTIINSPTCTEEGLKIWKCACGHSYTESIPKLDHDYSYNIETVNPTCEKEGYTKKTCICGKSQTNTIPAKGHSIVTDRAVSPGCETTGLTAGKHCKNCDYKVAQEVIPATGHVDTTTTTIDSTCVKKGSVTVRCSCGMIISKMIIREKGHTWIAGEVKVPTCTEGGYTNYTCACGETKTDDTTEAKGHTYHTETVNPTCENDGYTKYTCDCGDSYSETILATGHNYQNNVCTTCKKERFYSEGLEFIENDDGTYTVSGIGTCTDTDIVIPSVYNGKTVTIIGYYAFYECTNLTSISIPNSITNIKEAAFMNCSSLTSIIIPDSVISIIDNAFCRCSSLTEIFVSANNAYYCSENGVLFNKEKTELICYPADKTEASYSIPSGVTSIAPYAFYWCSSLTSVTIPDSMMYVGPFVFIGCNSLKDISVLASNEYYYSENGVLFNKAKTELIHYPAGKTETLYSIPDSVTSIGGYAFYDCDNLTNIVIPDSVTSIGSCAFENCNSLTSITIPDGVTSLGLYTFFGCNSLMSIVIPDSVTSIDKFAFSFCNRLTSIQFTGTTAQWQAIAFGSSWNYNTGNYTVTCTDGTVSKSGVVTPNGSAYSQGLTFA